MSDHLDETTRIAARGIHSGEAWSSFWSESDALLLAAAALSALREAGFLVLPKEEFAELLAAQADARADEREKCAQIVDDRAVQAARIANEHEGTPLGALWTAKCGALSSAADAIRRQRPEPEAQDQQQQKQER